ncbi:MAG: hypothetical protein PHV68_02350 [Candidatus Gastranaerophilales bacterium]|nr:hypothetical protein [Candidatus Gastranaerophilales bacterium]
MKISPVNNLNFRKSNLKSNPSFGVIADDNTRKNLLEMGCDKNLIEKADKYHTAILNLHYQKSANEKVSAYVGMFKEARHIAGKMKYLSINNKEDFHNVMDEAAKIQKEADKIYSSPEEFIKNHGAHRKEHKETSRDGYEPNLHTYID